MKSLHIRTPMFESRTLSSRSGRTVWLKMDAMQPPGSFKIRGIGHACQHYVGEGAKRLISSSGGNAGIAVAYAGRHLAIPVVVVVPETTTERAKSLIKEQNAEVIVHGASWFEANELAQSMVGDKDAFLHPFDDPHVWHGHSSLVDEVVETGVKPDAILLSVGGGGLLSGVAEGLHRHGWQDVPIIAAETYGAESLSDSIDAGERIRLDRINSIATSLGAVQICEQAFEWTRKHPVQSALVSDQEAVQGCLQFLDDHRVIVEPACGASLATLYTNHEVLNPFQSVLVVVCGGVTATLSQLNTWADA